MFKGQEAAIQGNLAKALGKAGDDLIMRQYLLDRRPKIVNTQKEELVAIQPGFSSVDKERCGSDDSDFEDEDEELDQELKRIQMLRIEALQKQAAQMSFAGEVEEIEEREFLNRVTNHKRVDEEGGSSFFAVVHFYHREFRRCELMGQELAKIARDHPETKFLAINAEKAPFFVGKLSIRVLPSVLIFEDGVLIDRIVGFQEICDSDDKFTSKQLEQRLSKFGGIFNAIGKRNRRKLSASSSSRLLL
jgi:hypothetical protein